MMMDDLDDLLRRCGDAPVDVRLAGIDAAVMAGVSARRDRVAARRSMVLAAGLALGIGAIGGTVPAAPARAVAIGLSDYAPSRLLAE